MLTDYQGNKVTQVYYKPYGETYELSGDDIFHYKYTGQEEDNTTGLYYYSARFYDSAIGRFISPDTMIPDPTGTQDFNRYMYVKGNPMKYSDPTGHDILNPYGVDLDIDSESGDDTDDTGQNNPEIPYYNTSSYYPWYTGQQQPPVNQTASTTYEKTGKQIIGGGDRTEEEVNANEGNIEDNIKAAGIALLTLGVATSETGVGIPIAHLGAQLLAAYYITKAVSKTVEKVKEYYKNKTYALYEKYGPEGKVYVGRASGYGTPEQIVKERNYGHHMNKYGYSREGRYVEGSATHSIEAIRGAEQALINRYKAEGISGNAINGISPNNPNRTTYIIRCIEEFGSEMRDYFEDFK